MRNEEDQESVIIGTKVETVALVSIGQDREFEKLRKSPCVGQIVNMRGTLVGWWPRHLRWSLGDDEVRID